MRRALCVGIDGYPFGALQGCVADAIEMSRLLERNDDGSLNFDVRLVTAPQDVVTRATLRESITLLFSQPAEVALFYFSGHGSENDLGGYLMTTDAEAYDEGVPMGDVITLANKSSVTEVVIILDCCHSGHLGNIPGPSDANAKVEIREGVSILTASRSSEPAMESKGRGVFTALLCSALDSGASDVLGHTNVASIFSYVDQSLGSWEQRPLIKTHLSSLLCLRHAAPSVDSTKLRLLTTLFTRPTDEFHLDPTFERTDATARLENVATYDVLVSYRNSRLVEVVTHEHLYYAAMGSGTARLTALGRHYWRLVKDGRL
jgi:hypothetical protein